MSIHPDHFQPDLVLPPVDPATGFWDRETAREMMGKHARRMSPTLAWSHFGRHPDEEIRALYAYLVHKPVTMQRFLAKDSSVNVLGNLARNPDTHRDLLFDLGQHSSEFVATCAVSNVNAPIELLIDIADNLASNPFLQVICVNAILVRQGHGITPEMPVSELIAVDEVVGFEDAL